MKCPCCDQELPEIQEVKTVPKYCVVMHRDSAVVLTRQQFKIVESVKRHRITFPQILDAVYFDDPNGGPPTAQWSVSTGITEANKRLREIGLRIKGDRGSSHVSLYGLVKLDGR